MARSVNKVILLGNLGKDAELSYTPSGQAVSKVSMATNRAWRDKNGELQEETEWHNLVLWGKQAESLTPYLSKGQRLYVEGRIKSRTWEAKDGSRHHATDIVVERVVFAGGRGEEAGARAAAGTRPAAAPAPAPATPAPEEGPQPDITDEDIPF